MDGQYRRQFDGFGPNRFDPHSFGDDLEIITGRRPEKLRQQVRERCPRLPGVYGMLDPRGRLIYVGKAKSLRSRLMSYFRAGSRGQKAGRIIDHTRALLWEPGPNEFAALLRELELIRRFRPGYNVAGQPGRVRFQYVCVGRRPAPYVYLARRVSAEVQAAFGPVPGSGRSAEAVRKINDYFGLRDCSQAQALAFADQPELFPIVRSAGCLRGELATCSAPCVGGITRQSYGRKVREARAFLEGKDDKPLRRLEAEMTAAAVAHQFERAAVIRDRWSALKWLQDRLKWLQEARFEYTFIYPTTGRGQRPVWYMIHRGRVVSAVDPENAPVARATIEQVYPRKGGPPGLIEADAADPILLVAGWFRKHPGERDRCLSPEQALELTGPMMNDPRADIVTTR